MAIKHQDIRINKVPAMGKRERDEFRAKNPKRAAAVDALLAELAEEYPDLIKLDGHKTDRKRRK
jgi:hypothetical protein